MGVIMPELIEQLADELGITVRRQGALRLIHLQDCGKIIDVCRSRRILVLGIEAFTVSKGKVVPNMDMIADFSALAEEEWDTACSSAIHSTQSYFASLKSQEEFLFDFSLQESPLVSR